jgi:2-polyprenyl-3-methyl-5-hydroxy-6-metoxy-1,4-benzoquinol methylase
METRGTAQQQRTELPDELAQRIWRESEENDAIYRQRSPESLDLLSVHYGHAQLLDWAFRQIDNLKGARILDVGVGDGFSSVLMALAGAQVTGIEVSAVALERAAALARRHGVELNLQQMPGEDLRFQEGSFDGILCMSAYHHMDRERAASEFARVLRPGGRLVLVEPLATNPPAWLYRRLGRFLSREATSEETPLRVRDLRFLRQHFRKVEWRGMYLLSLGLFGLDRIWNNANPLVHRITAAAFKWMSPLDSAILKIPGLQRIAWKIAIVADR